MSFGSNESATFKAGFGVSGPATLSGGSFESTDRLPRAYGRKAGNDDRATRRIALVATADVQWKAMNLQRWLDNENYAAGRATDWRKRAASPFLTPTRNNVPGSSQVLILEKGAAMIRVVVQNEHGCVVSKPIDAITGLIDRPKDPRFKCLRFVDPYGDTIFNYLQLPELSDDLRLLRTMCDPEHEPTIRGIETLIGQCLSDAHLYLKLIGD